MDSVITTKLENDLRVVSVERKNSLSVTIMVLVKVGSRYEGKEKSGIAHFVEHMFFKGTKKRPTSKDIGMAIEKVGGSSNAFTSHDFTGYYIKAPKESFEASMEILSDMISNGVFDEGEFEKERGVIIEEIRMYEDRPMSKVGSIWYEKFFGDSPLGRDIAGTIDTVNSMTREDLVDFVKTHYVGENIVVTVSGDIKNDQIVSLAKKYLEGIPEGDKDKFQPYEKLHRETEVFNLQKPIEQSHLILGGYSYKRDYEGRYIMEVADGILSKGFGSRLFQVIRDELGLAYYIYSSMNNFEDVGIFKCGLGVENSKVNLAVDSVMGELRKVINGDFSEEELERAKNYLLGNMVTEMESSDDHALWYGLQELLSSKSDSLLEVKDMITKVNKNEVIEEMRKVFLDQNFLLTGVTPHEKLDISLNGYLKI